MTGGSVEPRRFLLTGRLHAMRDGLFEWDDEKARSNLAVHKVSFEAARLVFADERAIDELDAREGYGEDRSNRTGLADGNLITVTYTERDDRYRIISARKATKNEHEAYFRQMR